MRAFLSHLLSCKQCDRKRRETEIFREQTSRRIGGIKEPKLSAEDKRGIYIC
jgi:hypothetical protein